MKITKNSLKEIIREAIGDYPDYPKNMSDEETAKQKIGMMVNVRIQDEEEY